MFWVLLAFLVCQRLTELFLSLRNQKWAMSRGGREFGSRHYPLLVILHVLFYVSLVAEYTMLSTGWSAIWPLWLSLLILAQFVRFWAIVSLGRFWNTRIIIVPGAEPVFRGPYRYIRHPNYVVVAVEILVIPLLCAAYLTAAIFSLLNAGLLWIRIREEEKALESLHDARLQALPRFIP